MILQSHSSLASANVLQDYQSTTATQATPANPKQSFWSRIESCIARAVACLRPRWHSAKPQTPLYAPVQQSVPQEPILEKLAEIMGQPTEQTAETDDPAQAAIINKMQKLLGTTEWIKTNLEFSDPVAAIEALKVTERQLNKLPRPCLETPLAQVTHLNIMRGLMNAYRYQAIKTPVSAEQARLLLHCSKHCAQSLTAAIPKDSATLHEWLEAAPQIDAPAFLGILYNDLGKFLKDTPEADQSTENQCARLRTAINLLEHAIIYAPENDPAAVFAREAWVDATIKLRCLEHAAPDAETTGEWPLLFSLEECGGLANTLQTTLTMTEETGNTGWKAYSDAKTKFAILENYLAHRF